MCITRHTCVCVSGYTHSLIYPHIKPPTMHLNWNGFQTNIYNKISMLNNIHTYCSPMLTIILFRVLCSVLYEKEQRPKPNKHHQSEHHGVQANPIPSYGMLLLYVYIYYSEMHAAGAGMSLWQPPTPHYKKFWSKNEEGGRAEVCCCCWWWTEKLRPIAENPLHIVSNGW